MISHVTERPAWRGIAGGKTAAVWRWLVPVGVLLAAGQVAVAAPRVVCQEPTHDFGVVTGLKDVEHTFHIENTGDADLQISGVRTTCGCTTTKLEQQTIAPGGKVPLGVTVSLRGRTGKQNKPVFVQSNDPAMPQYKLEISCEIVPDIAVQPASLSFGSLRPGEPASRTVELRAREGVRFAVKSVETNQTAFFSLKLETVEEGVCYKLTAEILPDALEKGGAMVSQVMVQTDYAGCPRVEVPVNVFIERDIMAIPTQLVLAPAAGSTEPVARYILVRSSGDKPIDLVDIGLPGTNMTQRVEKLTPGQLRIRVGDIRLGDNIDGKEIKIRVKKADGEEVKLDVPIRIVK